MRTTLTLLVAWIAASIVDGSSSNAVDMKNTEQELIPLFLWTHEEDTFSWTTTEDEGIKQMTLHEIISQEALLKELLYEPQSQDKQSLQVLNCRVVVFT